MLTRATEESFATEIWWSMSCVLVKVDAECAVVPRADYDAVCTIMCTFLFHMCGYVEEPAVWRGM